MASTQTATPSPVRGGFHYAYLIVFAGIVIMGVLCALVYSCAGIFFIPVSETLGVSKAAFSLYFSIANAAMMVSLPVAARLMTKMDIRVVLGAGTALCGLGLASFSLLDAVWQFYIVGALTGLGIAPLLYLAVLTLINAWCVKRMGFFVWLCMAFTGIGGVVFNPVGSMLIASGPEGWRTAYLVYGLIILMVALPVVVFVVRGRPEDKGLLPYGADEAAAGGQAVPALRGVPAARALWTSAFLALAAFCGLITLNQTVCQFLPSYLSALADAGAPALATLTGAAASTCMAGQVIGKVVLGTVSDRSAVGGLAFGLVSGIVGVLLMFLVPGVPPVLLAGAFLFGFAYACTTVLSPLLTRGVFGERDYTAIYAKISMVGSFFGAVAAVFWGWICDLPGGYGIMFTLSLAVMACCLALGWYALSRRALAALSCLSRGRHGPGRSGKGGWDGARNRRRLGDDL